MLFPAIKLKKKPQADQWVLSSAKHTAMCAFGEAESLVWLPHTIVMPDLAAYHVEEDAATEKNITAQCG